MTFLTQTSILQIYPIIHFFQMVLVRHVSHYIINYYLPSGLFVVVSWISFLVPSEIIPGEDFWGGEEGYAQKITFTRTF